MTLHKRAALLLLALLSAAPGVVLGQQPGRVEAAVQPQAATPRPGDKIALHIWNEREMSDTFNIAENGEVILPKLGPVYVLNQSIPALQDSLRRAYSVYLRNPSIEITVLRRIGIQGEIRQPGVYLADLTMALPDILSMAGGITDAGDRDNIQIVRGSERLRYRSRDQQRFLVAQLQSGDQIVVRPRNALRRNPTGTIAAGLGIATTFFALVVPAIRKAFEKSDKTGMGSE